MDKNISNLPDDIILQFIIKLKTEEDIKNFCNSDSRLIKLCKTYENYIYDTLYDIHNCEKRDEDENTCLMVAIKQGDSKIYIKRLIETSKNINALNYNGWTALHWAALR